MKNLKNEALQEGYKYLTTKYEEEIIYAKLEKQGFPVNIAKEAAKNVVLERNKLIKNNIVSYKKIGIALFCLILLSFTIEYTITKRVNFTINILYIIPLAIVGYSMTTSEI